MPRRLSRLSLLPILGAVALGATQLDAQRAVFRSRVEMVPLTVTVTDGQGKYVNHLQNTAFTVFEDGVPQQLSFFASEQVGVDLALVLDVSSSMHRNLPFVRKAATGLVRSLRPHDRATVAALKNAVGIPQALTDDHDQVAAAIQTLTASGDTALYDGLYVVMKELARARVGATEIRKQVMVLLSDGLDTSSRLAFEDVSDLAGRVGINIYVIALPASGVPVQRRTVEGQVLQAEFAMKSLARDSGGRAFFPKYAQDLPKIYSEIGTELANQYELGYLPTRSPADRAFRRVSVRVENAVARTRSGYFPETGQIALALPVGGALPSIVEPPQR